MMTLLQHWHPLLLLLPTPCCCCCYWSVLSVATLQQ